MVRRFVCAVTLVVSAMLCVRDAAADVITFDQAISGVQLPDDVPSKIVAVDNIVLPEPTALLLLGIALVLFARARRS